jgi:hypothetical protein
MAGGAFFERDCVCTVLDITLKNKVTGDAIAENDCRDTTPSGKWKNATGARLQRRKGCALRCPDGVRSCLAGQLTNEGPPGHWQEQFAAFAPKVDYTVIMIGDDYSVEYDCGTSFGITNYCIHVSPRTSFQTAWALVVKQPVLPDSESQADDGRRSI